MIRVQINDTFSSELQGTRARAQQARNGDETAGCGPDGAIQGGVGDLANVSKRP